MEEIPVRPRRRGFVIFIIAFLIIGAGVAFAILYPRFSNQISDNPSVFPEISSSEFLPRPQIPEDLSFLIPEDPENFISRAVQYENGKQGYVLIALMNEPFLDVYNWYGQILQERNWIMTYGSHSNSSAVRDAKSSNFWPRYRASITYTNIDEKKTQVVVQLILR
ncbi:MAG: hypothetical protein Q8P35_00625 [Candidatus Yanofskybacteria bacterium]|nr:hypothetical protein [Candidatus Yanofskybacteria bacterium]